MNRFPSLSVGLVVAVTTAACAATGPDSLDGEDREDAILAAEDPAIDEGASGPDTVDTLQGSVDVEGASSSSAMTPPVLSEDDLKTIAAAPPKFDRILAGKRVVELPLGLRRADLDIVSGSNDLEVPLIELGNLLFFDKRLSENKAMSCASCHLPSKGFAMTGLPKGVHGNFLPRIAPSAANRAFGKENTWIGGRTLEQQSIAPFLSADEMALTPTTLLSTVKAVPGYVERFNRLVSAGVLPAPAVSQANIGKAISAFQRSLMSGGSRVDQFVAGASSALTANEIAGRTLFHGKARCNLCHNGSNFSDEGFHNILSGCPASGTCRHPTTTFEAGRYEITKNLADLGKFKTPSLRNVGVRGPYFHAGHDATLKIAVHGYNVAGDLDTQIGQDPLLVNLGLTPTEEDQVVAYLQALTGTVPISSSLSQVGASTSSALRENYLLSPRLFNLSFYRTRNTDIPNIATMTDDQVRQHWINTGVKEGRRAVGTFYPKEYHAYRVRRGLAPAVAADGYLPVVQHYFDVGLRNGEELWGRTVTQPEFFDDVAYRAMNAARLGFKTREEVIWDFITYGYANKLGGRATYAVGATFKVWGVAGKFYKVVTGNTYCEKPSHVATGNELYWLYVPSNLTSVGICAP